MKLLKHKFSIISRYVLLLYLLIPNYTFSQDILVEGYWSEIDKSNIPSELNVDQFDNEKTVALQIDSERLFRSLETKLRKKSKSRRLVMEFPSPEGGTSHFEIEYDQVMHPELATKYPSIKTYRGLNVDDPSETVHFSISLKGLKAVISSVENGRHYIDPISVHNNEYYMLYRKQDMTPNMGFKCLSKTDDEESNEDFSAVGPNGDGLSRVYDLAMACTGEYALFHSPPGSVTGDPVLAMSAIVATVQRVNEIYQKEFAVSFWLIPNNNLIVFTDPASDPYDSGDAETMALQNQVYFNDNLESSNYDIGHVLDQSSSNEGIAARGVVCSVEFKALGASSQDIPTGDPFDIDYVCHEIGHQFNATHTFYSTDSACKDKMEKSTAFEPGSGSTIMAYPGVCQTLNVEESADAYFHAVNLQQIGAFVTTEGNVIGCPAVGSTPVAALPEVDALADVSLPKGTTFTLIGNGSAGNGSLGITNVWEQIDGHPSSPDDLPLATMPPLASNEYGPTFRSEKPTFWGLSRTFGVTPSTPATTNIWEVVPEPEFEDREINFNYTVRNVQGLVGSSAFDTKKVTILHDAGPFKITSPVTPVTPGNVVTITWDVANTDLPPLNIDKVGIYIHVNGYSWNAYLAVPTDNDGSEEVTIPENIPLGEAVISIRNYTPLWSSAGVTGVLFMDYTPSFAVTNFAGGGDPGEPDMVMFDGGIVDLQDLILNKGIQSYTVSPTGDLLVDHQVFALAENSISTTEYSNENSKIKIMPNPSNHVAILGAEGELIEHVFIYDATGKLARAYDNINDLQVELKKSEIGTGLFFAKVYLKDEVAVKKVIFE